ncbi:280_t:CDS:1 [Gigaspora margarita]|uniref:280_t:CDS:1 n=1 Tax=Gigaspora margarita TaxID=4874 RepID=A0ABN7VDL7_GIGMA|nr:280_t:CDS:1 [Gigaspora margarita]
MSDFPIPDIFKGKVIKRGDADYEQQSYQYASSSYLEEDIVRPAVIIQPADDDDVIKAIKYASDNKIAVAVRTGGHQYCGASSTSGKNIQLDLSQTYNKDPIQFPTKDPKDFNWENEDCTLVTFGVSYSLGDFNAKLRDKNRFVPHGQCKYVNLGGHVQTGGYGMLGRSFGLLSDYVEKFRIITADGQIRWIEKNNNEDKDLFFAVLGGSPGNFGVITHVTLRVFKDEDHRNSRGLRAAYPYNSKSLKALLDVMVEMVEDENFPADYDYCVTVLETPPAIFPNEISYDQRFNNKGTPQEVGQQQIVWPRSIVVFVQWANLQGDTQTYNPAFINKIRKAAGQGIEVVSDNIHTPMSTLTGHWIVPITREFDLPYIKRVYASNSNAERLKKFKWTNWVVDRIDNAYKQNLNLSVQVQHFGGSNSLYFKNGINSPTSFSWRDTNLGWTNDAFYHAHLYEEAVTWQEENDKEGVGNPKAKFSEQDHRVLWGSFDLDLSSNHQYYYDSEEKYQRLCQIKNHYDPSGVFTPNRFCIGLPPEDKQPRRIGFAGLKKGTIPEPHKNHEEKFWEMVSMEKVFGKPIPLWHTWRT